MKPKCHFIISFPFIASPHTPSPTPKSISQCVFPLYLCLTVSLCLCLWCSWGDLNIPKSSSEWERSPRANAMQICCLLCRNMRKGIYVRRSASQNSFLARAFALQSNVNWLQTQLADWVRTHTHKDIWGHTQPRTHTHTHRYIDMQTQPTQYTRMNSLNAQHIYTLTFSPIACVCALTAASLSLSDRCTWVAQWPPIMSTDHSNNGWSPGKCGAWLLPVFRHEKRTFQVAAREEKKKRKEGGKKSILGACANQHCRRQALW